MLHISLIISLWRIYRYKQKHSYTGYIYNILYLHSIDKFVDFRFIPSQVYFFLPKPLTNQFQVSLPPSSLCHSMAALAALPLPSSDELPVVVAKKLET